MKDTEEQIFQGILCAELCFNCLIPELIKTFFIVSFKMHCSSLKCTIHRGQVHARLK